MTRTIHGALAGMSGAATMNVLRMLAHRAGLIDVMVPQKVEQRVRRAVGVRRWPTPGAYRIVDQLLHLGYGATWGALFGAITPRAANISPPLTIAFGLGLWGLGSFVLFPALGIGRPAWASSPRENAVNIAAHLAYATATTLLVEELARQPMRDVETRRARAGRVG
ncbi:MAG TPA: hypothetical protein VG755_28440 [Nannocystaceae bacterium]|nr:hypothetical protein [Nannocystaceae bacterium]